MSNTDGDGAKQPVRGSHDWRIDVLQLLECVEDYAKARGLHEGFRRSVTNFRSDFGDYLMDEMWFNQSVAIPNIDQRETRIEAMQKNVEWLAEHDLDENHMEAAKRLGCIKGDVEYLTRSLGEGP